MFHRRCPSLLLVCIVCVFDTWLQFVSAFQQQNHPLKWFKVMWMSALESPNQEMTMNRKNFVLDFFLWCNRVWWIEWKVTNIRISSTSALLVSFSFFRGLVNVMVNLIPKWTIQVDTRWQKYCKMQEPKKKTLWLYLDEHGNECSWFILSLIRFPLSSLISGSVNFWGSFPFSFSLRNKD